jgi:hypothetical protein
MIVREHVDRGAQFVVKFAFDTRPVNQVSPGADEARAQ